MTQTGGAPAGGAFLIEEGQVAQTLIPEELTADSQFMAKTMENFVRKEVLPLTERLEAHEPGLLRSLIQKAGEIGLLGIHLPVHYDGIDLKKSEIALLTEKVALFPAFGLSLQIHSGVASLPLLFFGTPEQKSRYLPRLASGEIIGAFALSEANSGSDALSARTKAILSPDGDHYLLTGEKMWTTNGGFADLFTVFAQVDGDKFTAFLVERDTPGLTIGREEHKLGLKASSTCRLLLENAVVPAQNVLGEVGQGHRPALYCLNIGRFGIATSALGAAKEALRVATQYAAQRTQFGQPIANFGLIRQKLARMATAIFLLESMVYRVAGWWDTRFGAIDPIASTAPEQYRAAAEEYAIECAILKFYGTEVQHRAIDEALQIHGGFGFSEEFPMARAYRDARVTRIYEGTNEINRLTVPDQLLRRVERGRLSLEGAFAHWQEVAKTPKGNSLREQTSSHIRQIRATVLYAIHLFATLPRPERTEHQEVAAAIAEMAASLFALESGWLRSCKIEPDTTSTERETSEAVTPMLAVLLVAIQKACEEVTNRMRTVMAALSSGAVLQNHLTTVHTILDIPAWDTVSLCRMIADAGCRREGYPW